MARPHKFPEFPGVTDYERKGETKYRVRVKGAPERTLPDEFGSPAFVRAYYEYLAEVTKAKPVGVAELPSTVRAKTFRHAFMRLKTTKEWQRLDVPSQNYNAGLIERELLTVKVQEPSLLTWGDTPVEFMSVDHLSRLIDAIYASRPSTAKHTLNAIKKLYAVIVKTEKWIRPEQNPTIFVDPVRLKPSDANRPWDLRARQKFEARHPIGTAARTCYALGLWLGNRRGDVQNLSWDHLVEVTGMTANGTRFEIEAFEFRQLKGKNKHGGREMFIPIIDSLKDALAPLERKEGGKVLLTSFGEPFSAKALTTRMAEWTKQADLPQGYTLHGLRHTFGSMLAESNLQTRAVMEAMGHTDLKSTEHYMRRINQRRMMIDAARSLNDHSETAIAVNKAVLRVVK